MKKIILYILMVAASFGIYSSCNKNPEYIANFSNSDGSNNTTAYLKIVHASPNFATVFGMPDAFNVIVNGTKINSPFLSYAGTSIFPPLATNFGYVSVPAGTVQIKLSTNGVQIGDSLAFMIYSKTLLPNNFYTFMITDFAKSGNPAKEMFINDPSPSIADTTKFNVRFINAVDKDSATTSTGTTTVDVYSSARGTAIFSNVPTDGVTNFQSFPKAVGVVDTLYVTRTPATGSPALSGRVVLAKLIVTPIFGSSTTVVTRNFTLYYKGDGTLSTGTKARTLAYYINQ